MKFIIMLLLASACQQKRIEIVQLKIPYEDSLSLIYNTDGMIKSNSLSYIVKNYKDKFENEKIILAYGDSVRAQNPYGDLHLHFFKESSRTNVENLAREPRDYSRYSLNNDEIYWLMFTKSQAGKAAFKIIDGRSHNITDPNSKTEVKAVDLKEVLKKSGEK